MENTLSKIVIGDIVGGTASRARRIQDWLKTNPELGKGKLTKEFEEEWSKWIGRKYSVSCNSGSLANLGNITGSITSSNFVTQNKAIFESKQDKLIQGFDYYERYLYYESGAYAWPKTNDTKPFTNEKTNTISCYITR